MKKADNKRLLAVDILRGITIAGMLLVNNPGTWSHLYAPLSHAEWIGLTPTDLVFPFFMFVMGVAMYFSLRKFDFRPSGALVWKICRRTIILFLIGWAVQWFGMWLRGLYNPDSHFFVRMFGDLRILGVFQRLALVYFFGSMIAILCKTRWIPWIIGLILVVYAVILGTGNGYDFSLDNIVSRVDLAVLGEDHMYHEHAFGEKLALDPEGILSTLPCIAHVLIGFMMGKMLVDIRDNNIRMGKGLRANDAIPYRSAGPVFEDEYLWREERYDSQLVELAGYTEEQVKSMSLKERMAATRKFREDRYQTLIDAVYPKRGWTMNGVPTVKHLKELGMDLPELLEVVEPLLKEEV